MKQRCTSIISMFYLVLTGYLPLFSQNSNKLIRVSPDIELIEICDSVFVHTSWIELEGFGRFPSNGLVLVRNGKAFMIDTPNNIEQTQLLYNYLAERMNTRVVAFIAGHFHSDCIGGLSYLHNQGVESIASNLTHQKCVELGLPIPKTTFSETLEFEFEGIRVICRYLGAGHTVDNIVVYFPEFKILFGGCLVKSLDSVGLGNLSDAVVEEWDKTIENLLMEFPNAELVIPGHGNFGDLSLLHHTLELVNTFKSIRNK